MQWAKQRNLNIEFHLLYYGGKEGALAVLRKEIDILSPPNLLALDVATLGMLSNSHSDIERLSINQLAMETKGVRRSIVRKAIRLIEFRSRNQH